MTPQDLTRLRDLRELDSIRPLAMPSDRRRLAELEAKAVVAAHGEGLAINEHKGGH